MSNAGDYKKFFLLLSSDNDGEVIAAVRAINRKLKADGKDWHWLAGHLGSESTTKKFEPVKPQKTSYSDFGFGADSFKFDDWAGPIFNEDLYFKVKALHALVGDLPASHARFVRGMFGHFAVDPDFEPSPKQAKYIIDLFGRFAMKAKEKNHGRWR